MSGGGGSQTSTTSNAPPAEYLQAYRQVMGQATNVAATPYQNYPGQLQAGFSPQQYQGINAIANAQSEQWPYIENAAQAYTAAQQPLRPLMQPYVDESMGAYNAGRSADLQGALAPYQGQAAQGFGNVANTDLPGTIAPAQQAAYQGFQSGSQALTPDQYSGAAVQNYYNPYQDAVIGATQRQFNLQNAQQQAQLTGNAASQGALGGDRVGVAQAQLAGQQQTAQAPVIAGLENQGFSQAQQEFNNQQQTKLSAEQQSRALQQQAAQGYTALGNQALTAAQQQAALRAQAAQGFAGLGSQSMTAAQQKAALQLQAGQGIAGLGQAELGAGQSQGWLNAQTAAGMAGLGNQGLQGDLQTGNALLGVGGLEQQQAQTSLNIPYQQWQAALAYPYQTTGWLSNIAQGLGGSSGGTSSSSSPSPSAWSQAAGLGTAGAGLYGIGKQNGWWGSGAGAASAAAAEQAAAAGFVDSGAFDVAEAGASLINRGGAVGFAGGGGVPDVSVNGVDIGDTPGDQSEMSLGSGVPNASTSVVPGASGFGTSTGHAPGVPFLKRDYGSTSTSTPTNADSTIGSILKTAGAVAATFYGGPAGGMAANALGSQVHFDSGGSVPGDGGATPGDADALAGWGAVPKLNRSPVPSYTPVAHAHSVPKPPPAPKADNVGQDAQGWVKDLKSSGLFDDTSQQSNRGGHVPIASPGFAAGGSPSINVVTGPSQVTADLDAYLAQTAAGASHATPLFGPQPGPGGPVTPPPVVAPPPVDPNQPGGLLWNLNNPNWGSEGGGMAGGGMVRGFDGGGATDDMGDDEFVQPSVDFGQVTNQPVGQRFGDWLHGRSRDAAGRPTPLPPAPPSAHSDALDRPVGQMIPGFLKNAWERTQRDNAAFNEQTNPPNGQFDKMMMGRGVDPTVPNPDAGAPPPDLDAMDRGFDQSLHGRGTGDGTYPLPSQGPAPENHGGGWQPGVTSASDSTPAGPSGATTSGGFGTHGPGPPQPPPPPGQTQAPERTEPGFGARSGAGSDTRSDARAGEGERLDKNNPWLSLMIAGAGMMAGTSPNALANIGHGALAGLANYTKTDQAAKELAAKINDNRARLAETTAYRNASIGVRQQNADSAGLRAQSYAAMQNFKQANPALTATGLKDKMVKYWVDQGMSEGQAYDHVQGLDVRQFTAGENARSHRANEGLAGDRIDVARQNIMNTDAYRQAGLALRQQGLDSNATSNVMNNATQAVVKDITGRLTLADAVKQQLAARGTVGNQATTTTGAPKLSPPPPEVLQAAQDAIKNGANKADVIKRLGAQYDASTLTGP